MNSRKYLVESKSRKLTYNSIFCFFFLIISGLLFWKVKYGYANLDEAFYLTIPYRFLQGDKILFEEWNNTQLSAIPLLPILSLYIKKVGSADGIYIFIRYVYTICKCLIAILIYFKLKKYNSKGAIFSSLMFLCSCGYGLMVLSYNSMSIGGLICAILFLMTEKNNKLSLISYILSGISLSIAVLSIPHVVFLFLFYFILMIIVLVKKIKIENNIMKNVFSIRAFLGVMIGITISVIVFAIYLFNHSTLQEIISTLPYILKSDPNHPTKIWWKIIPSFIKRILMRNDNHFITLFIYGFLGIELLIMILDKKRELRKNNYITVITINSILLLITYFTIDGYINYMFFVPNILVFYLVLLFKDEIIKGLFICIWIPGMIFSLLEFIASNTGFVGIASASMVATVGSILIILHIADKHVTNSFCKMVLLFFIVLTISLTFYFRMTYIFWEDGIKKQTILLNEGPQSGLIVSEEKAKQYYGLLNETLEMRELNDNANVLYVADMFLWISGNQRCASYSPLCYGITKSREILYNYYTQHPNKIPNVIYLEIKNDYEMVKELSEYFNMKIKKQKYGYLLSK